MNSVSSRSPIESGFTLIEVLLVVLILGSFAAGIAISINPTRQINKAKDVKRQSDILEIKKGVELYYQDNNCFPSESEMTNVLASDSEWKIGNTIYIKKIPLDPDDYSYSYKTNGASCPQWMVVFAKLSRAPERIDACPLVNLPGCTPSNYDDTWACVTSGAVDCDYIASTQLILPTPIPSNTPTPTATPIPTNTPTPTPTPCAPANTYACTGAVSVCNSYASNYANCSWFGGVEVCYCNLSCSGDDCCFNSCPD